ncbi:MAG: hypothetical protein ACI4RT_03755 [Candidatus Spyradenecus sp.]
MREKDLKEILALREARNEIAVKTAWKAMIWAGLNERKEANAGFIAETEADLAKLAWAFSSANRAYLDACDRFGDKLGYPLP